jgi:drug/metabolite transporter (DMT)-like permease
LRRGSSSSGFRLSVSLVQHFAVFRLPGIFKTTGEIKKEWQTNRTPILICGILSIFGYFLILVAFTLDRVRYIVGLRQLSIVFAVLLGGYALKEKHQRMRFASASIIFVGTFLIALG